MPAIRSRLIRRIVMLGLALLLALGLLAAAGPAPFGAGQAAAATATAADAAAVIKLDPSYQHAEFDGWGTAFVWFGNITGGWPDEIKNELADALYGEDGLNFNIARYNIGGGDSPETEPYMRKGGAVPGYWNRPAEFGPPGGDSEGWEEPDNWWNPDDPSHWNWEADANQQWWIEAAKQRGANLFEAFSNSPPYFMTVSGYTSGHTSSTQNNMHPDHFGNFAIYLTRVVEHLQQRYAIDIQTLSPVNEPNTNYWSAGGRQEGSHWTPSYQARIINEVSRQLDERGLDTVVSAMDETNPQRFRDNWNAYDAETRGSIGQLNVHTYWPEHREPVRDISKGSGIRLWMSEVDLGPSGIPQNFQDIRPALALSQQIQGDIRRLEPKAWVMWQAIEDEVNMNASHENMNWGLIHVDFEPQDFSNLEWHKNKKYYAMGNYSKFIRPGYQFINASDTNNTLAAIHDESETVVIVYTNNTAQSQAIEFDLSGFASIRDTASATPHVTSAASNLERQAEIAIANKTLSAVVEPQSITTFVVHGVSGVNEDRMYVKADRPFRIINKHSGKAMDLQNGADSSAPGVSVVQYTADDNKATQLWLLEKLTDGYRHTNRYKVVNAHSGLALGIAAGSAVQVEYTGAASQQWMLSTFGNGEYTLINVENGDLLEVGGQSTADGAGIGRWQPNNGNNQLWRLVRDVEAVDAVPVEVVTPIGAAPRLPETITVIYDDGSRGERPVAWEDVQESDYAAEGTFEVSGTVEGQDGLAKAIVVVSVIERFEPLHVKAVQGHLPQLPPAAEAVFKSGHRLAVPVQWEPVDIGQVGQPGQFAVAGRAANSDIEVIARVMVASAEQRNIALRQQGSVYPVVEASFTSQYDSLSDINDGVISYTDSPKNRWTNWVSGTKRPSDWVSFNLGETQIIKRVNLFGYRDSGCEPPASVEIQIWDGSGWVAVDGTLERTDLSYVIEFAEEVLTSQVRVQMTNVSDRCMAITELEIYGLVPAIGEDASLTGIAIDGSGLTGFSSGTFEYTVVVPPGTEQVPEVAATAFDLFATVAVQLPSALPGDAVITVTSEDGSRSQQYRIRFRFAASPPLTGYPGSPGGFGYVPQSYTAALTASGGTIAYAGATLDIPAGALNGDTIIRIQVMDDSRSFKLPADSELWSKVYKITKNTEGSLESPVRLSIAWDETKALNHHNSIIRLAWYDETRQEWISLDNLKVDDTEGVVYGEIDHFAHFAVLATARPTEDEQLPSHQPDGIFTDLSGHWAEEHIIELAARKIIGGYPDGTYKPNRHITRAEFVALMVRALGLEETAGAVFADTAHHWARDYIAAAAAHGIVAGYSDTAFGPDDRITREQIARIMMNSLQQRAGSAPDQADRPLFTDEDEVSPWAADAVKWAAHHQWMQGYPDQSFKPGRFATRAEAAATLYRALTALVDAQTDAIE